MTATPNLGMTLPTVGADADAWGTELNTALTTIDTFATPATRQKLTSGSSATYTPPTGCRYIRVTLRGGGGGTSGTGTSGATGGGVGGDTSFDGVVAKGGKTAGANGAGSLGGTGGTDNGFVVSRKPGAPGLPAGVLVWSSTPTFVTTGGAGGGKGGGTTGSNTGGSVAGTAGVANSGGGASAPTLPALTAAGLSSWTAQGGGGEAEEAVFWHPAAQYTFTIAAGGAAGSAGTSGAAGAAGGSGSADVEEFY